MGVFSSKVEYFLENRVLGGLEVPRHTRDSEGQIYKKPSIYEGFLQNLDLSREWSPWLPLRLGTSPRFWPGSESPRRWLGFGPCALRGAS